MIKQKAIRKEKECAFVDLLNQEMKELQESQKQIEEMAKDLVMAFTKPLEKCLYPESTDCKGKSCERFNPEAPCRFMNIAENLYNAGCRKIPKNTVLTNNDIAELLSVVARDTRKDTAKEIYYLMTGEFEVYFPNEIAKEIAERYGVEVE